MRVTWRKQFEHIRLTGRSDEMKKMLNYCYKRGFDVKYSGPKVKWHPGPRRTYIVTAQRELEA